VTALGVRGPDVAAARPAGVLRLLFLGDSVTWGGSYVDDDALFAAVSARALAASGHRVEWLDAGVNGWGPQNILGFVEETGGLDGSVWIVTALEDDFRREKTHVGEVPYMNRAPHTAWEELLVLAAYKVVTAYKTPKPAADLARLADENLATYRAVAEAGTARGARVLLVWHPTTEAVAGAAEPERERFLALAREVGGTGIDLTPAYRAAGGKLYVDGLHLSTDGHRVAGEAIGAALVGMLAAHD
jgi:lysophospholipase L1-like esterase